MLTAVLMLVAGAQANFSYDFGVYRVDRLLEIASKSAGRKYKAGEEFRLEFIASRVRKKSLADWEKMVAASVNGDWKDEKDVRILYRSPATKRRLQEAEAKLWRTMWEKFLAETRAKVRDMGSTEQEVESLRRGYQKMKDQFTDGTLQRTNVFEPVQVTPVGILLNRLLLTIKAETIAGLPTEVPTTFTDRPSGVQRPLPIEAMAEFTRYDDLLEGVRRGMEKANPDGYEEEWQKLVGSAFANLPRGKSILNFMPSGGTYLVNLSVYAQNGKLLDRAAVWVPRPQSPTGHVDEQLARALQGTEIILSPEAMEVTAAMRDGIMHKPKGLSPKVLERFANPEKYEPLENLAGPSLDRIAQILDADVMVPLPDGAEGVARKLMRNEHFALAPFVTALHNQMGLSFKHEGGWLTGEITRPLLFEGQRLDRAVAGTYLRAVLGKGGVELREYAKLCGNIALLSFNAPLLQGMLEGLTAHGIERPGGFDVFAAIRLLGQMEESEWRALEAGQAVSIAAADSLMIANWSVTGAERESGAQVSDQLLNGGEWPWPLAFAKLVLKRTDEPVLMRAAIGKGTLANFPILPANAEDVGHIVFAFGSPEGNTAEKLLTGKYFFKSRPSYDIVVQAFPGIRLACDWRGSPGKDSSEPLSYPELPESFRNAVEQQVQKEMQEAKKK